MTGPICWIEVLEVVELRVLDPGRLIPAAATLPATPCPSAVAPTCEELAGTPGSAPPASERVTFHFATSGL